MDLEGTGRRVEARRRDLGLSRDAVARATGISSSALYKLEAKGRIPGGETLAKLAVCLGTTTDFLLGLEAPDPEFGVVA